MQLMYITLNVLNVCSCDDVLQLHVLQEDIRITVIYQFQKRYALASVIDFLLKLMKSMKFYQHALVFWSVEGWPFILSIRFHYELIG